MGNFCRDFPDNFESEILPEDAKECKDKVYHVMKYNDPEDPSLDFLSTYEEIVVRKLHSRKKPLDLNDPSTYSTSCFLDKESALYLMDIFRLHYPRPYLAEGFTRAECGVSQKTYERTGDEGDKHHVDWWLYENSSPHRHFEEVKDE